MTTKSEYKHILKICKHFEKEKVYVCVSDLGNDGRHM